MTDDEGGLMSMHADQLTVPVQMVRTLVAEQFPEWANQPIRELLTSIGTVNAIFRIGDSLAARFSLQGEDRDTVGQRLRSEADAARELVGRTRFPVPEPVVPGQPGAGYPLPWSVQTWLSGTTASDDDPGGSDAFAHDLAEFILGVRGIDTRGRTFTGSGRR